jgi:hypothetical protein
MTLATLSDGRKIGSPRHFNKYQALLAKAQRASKKKRVQAIHSKIVNVRRHYLHVLSASLARDNRLIVVGNIVARSLPYRSQRKSAIDASWSQFRSQLRYKASRHGPASGLTGAKFCTSHLRETHLRNLTDTEIVFPVRSRIKLTCRNKRPRPQGTGAKFVQIIGASKHGYWSSVHAAAKLTSGKEKPGALRGDGPFRPLSSSPLVGIEIWIKQSKDTEHHDEDNDDGDQDASQDPVRLEPVYNGDHAGCHKPDDDGVDKIHRGFTRRASSASRGAAPRTR